MRDLAAIVPADRMAREKERLTSVLHRARGALGRMIEIVAFQPGRARTLQPGPRGPLHPVEALDRSRLRVRVGGKERRLRFRRLIKLGEKWKILAL